MIKKFKIGDLDLTDQVSTFSVGHQPKIDKVITTLDGTEHVVKSGIRDIIKVSFLPITDATDLYNALSKPSFYVEFVDGGINKYKRMRVSSDLEMTFLLKSPRGDRYYRPTDLELREL